MRNGGTPFVARTVFMTRTIAISPGVRGYDSDGGESL